jgi:hypothetical protein
VTAVDDPSDGTGDQDKNPDDYKRVSVDLTWEVKHGSHRVHQVAVINHPGSAGGPAVKNLTITPPASAKITTELGSAGFAATTSTSAASVAFSVDGVTAATATGAGTSWNFSWPIAGLTDGTHLVTAQAFDRQGLSGATRSVTVTLNRFLPRAPVGLAGGRNGSVVELEWLPNTERDIVGYRAYRIAPGGAQLVCPLSRNVSCEDPSPPAGTLQYYVAAADLSPDGDYRDGDPSAAITVLTSSMPPYPPWHLTAEQTADGTKLTWNPSDPADDTHDAVAFYRIYRDGTSFADRYDRTGTAAELSLIDGRTDGQPHEYWVTAVNSQLAESDPIGPVTG